MKAKPRQLTLLQLRDRIYYRQRQRLAPDSVLALWGALLVVVNEAIAAGRANDLGVLDQLSSTFMEFNRYCTPVESTLIREWGRVSETQNG